MLDVKTLKILRFLNEHPDETFSSYQMEKCGVPADGETLDWLYKHDMVSRYKMKMAMWILMTDQTTSIRSMPVGVRNCADSSTLKKLKNVQKEPRFALKMQRSGQVSVLRYPSLQ